MRYIYRNEPVSNVVQVIRVDTPELVKLHNRMDDLIDAFKASQNKAKQNKVIQWMKQLVNKEN